MRSIVAPGLLIGLAWGGVVFGDDPEETPPDSEEPSSDELTEQRWLQVTSRMENASSDIGEAARAISQTAQAIEADGRLSRLTQLSGHSTSLDHKIIQARLASEQLLDP